MFSHNFAQAPGTVFAGLNSQPCAGPAPGTVFGTVYRHQKNLYAISLEINFCQPSARKSWALDDSLRISKGSGLGRVLQQPAKPKCEPLLG